MSREFVEAFFADGVALLNQFQYQHVGIFDILYPKDSMCPEDTIIFQGLTFRWPLLFPIALLGAIIGYSGFLRGLFDRRISPFYVWAFFYFGSMNLSAILCHNIVPLKGTFHGIKWDELVKWDCGFTGASSLNLMFGAIFGADSLTNQRLFGHLLSFGIGAGVVYLDFWGHENNVFLTNEIVYIGITVCASIAIATRFLLFKSTIEQKLWIATSFFGLFLLSGTFIDALLCEMFGKALNSIHLVFLGCDIVFLSLWFFIRAAEKKLKKE